MAAWFEITERPSSDASKGNIKYKKPEPKDERDESATSDEMVQLHGSQQSYPMRYYAFISRSEAFAVSLAMSVISKPCHVGTISF